MASESSAAGGATTSQVIDIFLAEAKAMGDRVPTDAELRKARVFLRQLEAQTREDHLRSVDELLSQVPSEMHAKTKQLQEAESFVLLCSSGETDKVTRGLGVDWELVNAVDRDGHTPLHAAAACDHADIARFLLDKGAHPSTQDHEGFSPLHWAVENDSLEVAQILLDHGVETGLRNHLGKTARDLVNELKPDRRDQWRALAARLAPVTARIM
mmetsp:Transcript_1279/g.4050  ORF Transcript_1279/g.4050 Transcript_1279/m.4050 type:complete len:213 (-) Transcript_1279:114-752(-)